MLDRQVTFVEDGLSPRPRINRTPIESNLQTDHLTKNVAQTELCDGEAFLGKGRCPLQSISVDPVIVRYINSLPGPAVAPQYIWIPWDLDF